MSQISESIPYPVRINRYLALKGVSTRRGAESLITAGKVTINGRTAVLTDRVNENDDVIVRNHTERKYRYFAYNKPRGIVTHSPQNPGEKAIADVAGIPGVFPVGRLDKSSEGLMILTDDGRVTERLLSPRFAHEKEYLVTVREDVRPDMLARLADGPMLEDGPTKRCVAVSRGSHMISLTITEGRKHQVRRMLDAVGGTVTSLRRIRIMRVPLGNLPSGKHRQFKGDDLQEFLSDLGLV
ncbi:MAG: rRNA pseudouridine synthase [Candidatus Moranbacteria bacterium]|nr:rRNA pseudouridine synthase [Candidatus Moranbacteria bacterium]